MLCVEWMRQTKKKEMPPQIFWDVLQEVVIPAEVSAEITILVEAKKNGTMLSVNQGKAPRMVKLGKTSVNYHR